MTRSRLTVLTALLLAAAAGPLARAQGAPNPVVALETTLGAIHIELECASAPVTGETVVEYVPAERSDGPLRGLAI